jgi:DNA-binding NarL/FixJ family response regulator
MARAGRLDADAVDAVLAAAGQGPCRRRATLPAGLVSGQVEVLPLVVRGLTTRQITTNLVVSAKTSGVGVSTRGAAALYAMEHDLRGALG